MAAPTAINLARYYCLTQVATQISHGHSSCERAHQGRLKLDSSQVEGGAQQADWPPLHLGASLSSFKVNGARRAKVAKFRRANKLQPARHLIVANWLPNVAGSSRSARFGQLPQDKRRPKAKPVRPRRLPVCSPCAHHSATYTLARCLLLANK